MTFSFVDSYDHQQPQSTQQLSPVFLNNQRYTPALRASWDFFPKTSIFLEGTTTFTNFDTNDPRVAVNGDSWIYSGYTGINGQISKKLTALAKVTATPGSPRPCQSRCQMMFTANTVGAQAEMTWEATPMAKIRLGGLHQFEPVSVFLFSTMWKAYALTTNP